MQTWRTGNTWTLGLGTILLVGLLTACPGGTDRPPGVSSIADQTTFVGQTLDVPFTVSDEHPDNLTLTATSNDPTLVADTDLDVLGTGTYRTLHITPAPQGHGSVTITLAVRDSQGQETTASFGLVVRRPFETTAAKLLANDAADGDRFGRSVSLSGEYAIIGAPLNDVAGADSGSAYIVRRSGDAWAQIAKLIASDGAAGAEFGNSVSMSGDYAIVGARFDDAVGTDSGAAYVFHRSGDAWAQVAKLTANDGAPDDYFGGSVAISGDHAVVGAPFDDAAGSNSGSAYVFHRSGDAWVQVAKLTPSDGAADDAFGWSAAVSGDYAVVGAPFDDAAGTNSGSAYVFQRCDASVTSCSQPWVELGHLVASDNAAGDTFGLSVAVSGNAAVVGAPQDDDAGSESGSAYVFGFNGLAWAPVDKLTASDGAPYEYFGYSVAMSGDYVVAGAPVQGGGTGVAYVFRHDGQPWDEVNELTASDGATYGSFGEAVAVSEDYAVLGAPTVTTNGALTGAAYAFPK